MIAAIKTPSMRTKGLPWALVPSKVKAEDAKIFKWLQTDGRDPHKYRLEFYNKFKNLFPPYLPIFYYKMECRIHPAESTTLEAQWNQITQLLLLTYHNELDALHHWSLTVNCCTSCHLENGFIHITVNKDSFQTNHWECCQKAEEFLLEPWILVQLPFKPVLLHQWLVAALAESLKFEKLVVEFFKLKFPAEHKEAVLELNGLLRVLKRGLSDGFKYVIAINDDKEKDPRQDQSLNLQSDKALCRSIEEMLPVLEFIMSTKATDLVNALKRKSWSEERQEGKMVIMSEAANSSRLAFWLLDLGLWLGEVKCNIFQEKFDLKSMKPQKMITLAVADNTRFPKWIKEPLKKIKSTNKHLDADLAKFLCYGGFSKLVPLAIDFKKEPPLKDENARKYYAEYIFFEGLNLSAGLRDEDSSVLFDILRLEAELKMTEAACDLLQCYAKETGTRLTSVCDEGCQVDVEEIKSAFQTARLGTEKWKFCNIIDSFTQKLSERPEESLEEMGPVKVVRTLEMRIKRLVLKMVKCCFAHSPKPNTQRLVDISEWDVAQFILPCLVSSLAKLHQDIKDQDEAKTWLQKFVVEMIASYEDGNCFTYQSAQSTKEANEFFLGSETTPISTYTNLAGSWELVKNRIPHSLAKVGLTGLDKLLTHMCKVCKVGTFSYDRNLEFSWRLVWRVRHVLDKIQNDPAEKNQNYLQLLLVGMLMIKDTCACFKQLTGSVHLEEVAFKQFQLVSAELGDSAFQRMRKAKLDLPFDLLGSFKKQAKSLSSRQLLGIIVYVAITYSKFDDSGLKTLPLPSAFDLAHQAFFWFRAKNLWRLKQILSKWMMEDEVSFDFAWKTAPVCYSLVFHNMNLKRKKLKLLRPGTLTFCPIKHCRWCGLVESSAGFRSCSLCLEDEEYKDVNIFCSESCEQEALDVQHNEEHCRAQLIEFGLTD